MAKRKDDVGGMSWEGLMRADAVFLLRTDFFPCCEERRPVLDMYAVVAVGFIRRVKAGLGEVGGGKGCGLCSFGYTCLLACLLEGGGCG